MHNIDIQRWRWGFPVPNKYGIVTDTHGIPIPYPTRFCWRDPLGLCFYP